MPKEYLPATHWTGPPVLFLKLSHHPEPEVIDGRKRLEEYRRRGLSYTVPSVETHSHYEAVKGLLDNSEQRRAIKYIETHIPYLLKESNKTIQALLGLKSHHKLIPLRQALQDPAQRHKLPRRTMDVVKRARTLYQKAQEGYEITIPDLEHVLGAFIDD